MRKCLLVTTCLGLIAGAVWAVPAPRITPKLLYSSNRTGNFEIFLMSIDGKGAFQLTDNPAEDSSPAWSRDGKKIAFTSQRDGDENIYVMDADGKNVKQLTKYGDRCRAPAWSPDGKKIAFCRHVGNANPEIFVMDADGSNPVNLTNHVSYDADPAWSPDGKKLAFASDRGGRGFRVYLMDADGTNVQDFSKTDNAMGYAYPAWSPDGKKIAYAELVNNDTELFVRDLDGQNKKQLTRLGGQNSLAAWSPDGKKIAFQHSQRGAPAGSLYIMNADGSDPKEIIRGEGPIEGGRPAWRPR